MALVVPDKSLVFFAILNVPRIHKRRYISILRSLERSWMLESCPTPGAKGDKQNLTNPPKHRIVLYIYGCLK